MKSLKPVFVGAFVLGAALAAFVSADYVPVAKYVMTDTNNVVNSHADLVLGTGESLTDAVARLDIAEPVLATALQPGDAMQRTEGGSLWWVDALGVTNLVYHTGGADPDLWHVRGSWERKFAYLDAPITASSVTTTGPVTAAEARIGKLYDSAGTTEIYDTADGSMDERYAGWRVPVRGGFSTGGSTGVDVPSDNYLRVATNSYAGAYLHFDYAPSGRTGVVIRAIYTTAAEANSIHHIEAFPYGRKEDGSPPGYGAADGATSYVTNSTGSAMSGVLTMRFPVPYLQATNGANQVFFRRGASSTGDFGRLDFFTIMYRYE